ncbi:hypothetical protein BP5796_06145 [Coleophoma crateriformis]|uniref:Acetyl-CoA synthetase-like protein n=1 Tax=Coleophoma crateriformis TaxID=565419 RepID=A0A3D8RW62_9HELO|nr:hypothetical protein BP5796_06145 [Coleophoma crateriformis]
MSTADVTAVRRLRQTTAHLRVNKAWENVVPAVQLSLIHGETTPPLRELTLAQLLEEQVAYYGERECLVVAWSETRWTYGKLLEQSRLLAKSLLVMGIQKGDRVGILAGNCEEYIALFFAVGMVGGILVVLNSTYTSVEARYALKHSGCRVLFLQEKYGPHSNSQLLRGLEQDRDLVPDGELEKVIMLRGTSNTFSTYDELLQNLSPRVTDDELDEVKETVDTHDIVNLQYTSGSTGDPKAASLTHHNLINNAGSIGSRMSLTSTDILCCPPPLFHCFGLVLGVLACLTHGAKVVLPSQTFSAPAVLASLSAENCTALHGVPAMFEELLSLPRPERWSCPNLRTGIVAGAPVPKPLMERMLSELGMHEFTSSYGLTEASPTCFNATTFDTIERRLTTVGRLLPHLHAKIIDRDGHIVPIGARGELCIAGYSLQKGYWKNEEKTNEVMRLDENGVRWLHTGDEAVVDFFGYCTITGRFKDIIIRGGENIYPLEIETRLVAHPSGLVSRCAVVGIKHHKYGEVVGAFILPPGPSSSDDQIKRPTDDELRAWVRVVLGRHKAPAYIFWFGDERVGLSEVPQTGSGKVKKHFLRDLAQVLVAQEGI